MNREDIVKPCERNALDTAAHLFGASKDQPEKFDDYGGCANLVYHYKHMENCACCAPPIDPNELRYRTYCIESGIPYLGFFDSVFLPIHIA